MNNTLKRIRGSVLTGLAWAVVWAPLAILVGTTIIDPDNSMDEMWIVIGAYPGFLCGALSYATLGNGRGFREVSYARAAASGAIAGLVVGVLPFLIGSANPDSPSWMPFAVIGAIFLMSVASAVVSVLVAGMARRQPNDVASHVV